MNLRLLCLLGALVMGAPASAHDVPDVGPNGGRVAVAGAYHVEMVVKDDAVRVFLMDHDNKARPTDGFKGLAILAVEGKSQRIVLAPSDNKSLSGKVAGAGAEQPKGIVQITVPGGATAQAKFN